MASRPLSSRMVTGGAPAGKRTACCRWTRAGSRAGLSTPAIRRPTSH